MRIRSMPANEAAEPMLTVAVKAVVVCDQLTCPPMLRRIMPVVPIGKPVPPICKVKLPSIFSKSPIPGEPKSFEVMMVRLPFTAEPPDGSMLGNPMVTKPVAL